MTTTSNKSSFPSYFCRVKANDLVLFGILFVAIFGSGTAMAAKMGGMGNVKSMKTEPSSEVAEFLKKVQTEAEAKANRTFGELEAVEYATQLVNGINYFIKARTDGDKYVFLRLYKPFTGEVSFVNLLDDKTAEDPLVYF